ncbi:MAG: transporter substrate-binding domain-containing protein, partial [Chloroflexota bacterium]
MLLMLVMASVSLASGAVYDDLPDLEGQEILVAVENQYTPYQFEDPRADEPIGFEYDIVEEVCRRINCVPIYETTTFEIQLSGTANGDFDLAMNGLFLTEERAEVYDFSIPYTQAEAYLLARAGEDRFTDFVNFAEVAVDSDLIIGVQSGSFGQFLVTPDAYNVPESQVVTFDEFGALLVALENGDIDTMVVDAFGGEFVSSTGDIFELVGEPVADPVDTGFIFPKDSDLDEAFNAALESMMADGYLDYLTYKWSVDFAPLAEE